MLLVLAIAACGHGASGPDANPADVDGDGVLNAADNCPERYIAEQHDEDGDGVGDVCDNCPTIANTNQSDVSETAVPYQLPDGVGDACDLRPGLAGDLVVAFYPFADPQHDAAWTAGGWVVGNDDATADGDADMTTSLGIALDGTQQVELIAWRSVDALHNTASITCIATIAKTMV